MILALTYVLYLLLVMRSQFQRKILRDRDRSYIDKRKYIAIDIGV